MTKKEKLQALINKNSGLDIKTIFDHIDKLNGDIQSKVKNGKDGKDGTNGKDGYSPVRGVDYWTVRDQEKILRDVLKQIPKPKDGISPNIDENVNKVKDGMPPINFKDEVGKI